MASYDLTKPHTETWEGGKDDNPKDRGGKTNHGVILSFWEIYSHLVSCSPSLIGLWDLTWDQAHEIYRQTFWEWMHGDDINDQRIASTLFDHFLNADERRIAEDDDKRSRAVMMIQEILGVSVDGVCGLKETVPAINAANPDDLFKKYQDARRKYYTEISKYGENSIFLNGWLKRVDALG